MTRLSTSALLRALALAIVASTSIHVARAEPASAGRDADEAAFLGLPVRERLGEVDDAVRALGNERATTETTEHAVQLLGRALRDDEELNNRYEQGCGLLRIRDLAARALAPRAAVEFNCSWPVYQRNAASIRILNWFRAQRGQPALPGNEPPSVPSPRAGSVRAAQTLLAKAGDADEVRRALAAWEKLGLGGLTPLRETLAALPAGHVARVEATPVLARLASTIREVKIYDDAHVLPDKARFSRGEPLTAEALVAKLRAAYQHQPSGTLVMRVDRDPYDRGVRVGMRALKGEWTPELFAKLQQLKALRAQLAQRSQDQQQATTADFVDYKIRYFEPLAPSHGFSSSGAGSVPGEPFIGEQPERLVRAVRELVEAPPGVGGELILTMSWPSAQPPLVTDRRAASPGPSSNAAQGLPAATQSTPNEFERACDALPPLDRFPDQPATPDVGQCRPTPLAWAIPAEEMNGNSGRSVGPGLCYGVVHFGHTGESLESCGGAHCATLRYCDGNERPRSCSVRAECRNGQAVATGFSW